MAKRRAKQCPERTAQHEAETATDDFSPPAQNSNLMNQFRPRAFLHWAYCCA